MSEATSIFLFLAFAILDLVVLVWFLFTLHGIASNLRELVRQAREQTRVATYSAERLRSIQNLLIEEEDND